MARSWGEVWERVRLSLALGRAYDAGLMAARNNDTGRFEQARRALEQLSEQAGARALRAQAPLSRAEEEVASAIDWTNQAQSPLHAGQQAQLEQKAADSYRRALQISAQAGGEFSSSNPELLNGLGYFLADKGTSPEDFKRAERLAREALKLQDQEVSDARQKAGEAGGAYLLARYSRANTRDSLAWAQFKQAASEPGARAASLLEASRREQQAALDEARHSLAELKALNLAPPLSAELPYHLAMILRAQNALAPAPARLAQAQSLLREAAALQPDFAPAQQALKP